MEMKKPPSLEGFVSVVLSKRRALFRFGLGLFALLLVFMLISVGSDNGAADVDFSDSMLLWIFSVTPAVRSPHQQEFWSPEREDHVVERGGEVKADIKGTGSGGSAPADGSRDRKGGALEKSDRKRTGVGSDMSDRTNAAPQTAATLRVSSSGRIRSGLDGKCDTFKGRWVRDESKPYYPPGSCPYIDPDFNCQDNGRPDDDFMKWRWQPNECEIPRLNATDFLRRLSGQRLIFVGDSLNRNMWESLVCILRHSIQNKNRVYEMSGKRQFKTSGYYSIIFEDYNCSVDFVRSPFLVREVFNGSLNGSEGEKLRLDVMDGTTSAYQKADIVVFNTGHWWTHEKTSKGINYYQEGDRVYSVLDVMEAYKKALWTWAKWVDENIDSRKTQVMFRGYSRTHFSGGQWNSGGQCHQETEPITNQSFLRDHPDKMTALEQVLMRMRTPVIYLNVSRLTDYRKDGHPSIYRKNFKTSTHQIAREKPQDCSHWCLPGVPDAWNELLYASLLTVGRGSWGTQSDA
ncbi:unnamed protein product [Spirodela intermedia]|uniref:Uncharacterized protein n=1 Tax=Spirodela intermedia TaxID=51605 RepID=A0A7I8KWX0_SPIIN|nr:unnamed protein product [Spirodela intermedia]